MTIMVEGDGLVPQALLLRCRRSPDTNHESSVPNSAAGPTSQGLTGLTTNTHGRMWKQRRTLSRCWRTPSALCKRSPSPLFATARNMSPTISQEKDTPLNLNRNVRPLHVDTSSQLNGSHPPALQPQGRGGCNVSSRMSSIKQEMCLRFLSILGYRQCCSTLGFLLSGVWYRPGVVECDGPAARKQNLPTSESGQIPSCL
jgi:hypothetical protein